MSDVEGPEDFGGGYDEGFAFEYAGEEPPLPGDEDALGGESKGSRAPGEADEEGEDPDLDEIAFGEEAEPVSSLEEEESADEAAGLAEEEGAAPSDYASSARPARAERPRANPLLQESNRPRVAHVVPPEERVTDSRLQRPEAAQILGMRAQQIAKYGTVFTDPGGLHDPVALAHKELYDRCCPLTLIRHVGEAPDGGPLLEKWLVREMVLPLLAPPAAGAAAPPA